MTRSELAMENDLGLMGVNRSKRNSVGMLGVQKRKSCNTSRTWRRGRLQ